MPIIKSAKKRVRQDEKRRERNYGIRRKLKTAIKDFMDLIKAGKTEDAAKLMPEAQKAIDMAAKKNIIHKNTANRRKSRLANMMPKKG
jgi:small subunit ribosomal protein S20